MKRKNILVVLFILLVLSLSCVLIYNKVHDIQQKKGEAMMRPLDVDFWPSLPDFSQDFQNPASPSAHIGL
ncbi:MAG: hypothetical protein LBB84_07130 [Tannerellaceae bacterium]|nr:hypothetical protein [Tannerellaceae bacterium]